MPWRRREERERLGLAEQRSEEQQPQNEQPPEQAKPKEGGLFGRGKKKEPAEQKSSEEP
jgi:hypothetical protein